jgi:electron transport complex protein RnfB
MNDSPPRQTRRELCTSAIRYLALGGVTLLTGGLVYRGARARGRAPCPPAAGCEGCAALAECTQPQAAAARRGPAERLLWQIDPDQCIACDRCQTHCVLDISAVKSVQCFALCGYCDVCTGYFPTKDFVLATGAENQLCPTGAITRRFIEEQAGERFFEYTINESLCIGCGKCVAGCRHMNGSLYLQVRHDRCLNCNECAIAVACPTQAFRRVPAGVPNLLSQAAQGALRAQQRKGKKGTGTFCAKHPEGGHRPKAGPGKRCLSPFSPPGRPWSGTT